MVIRGLSNFLLAGGLILAQSTDKPPSSPAAAPGQTELKQRDELEPTNVVSVPPGTHILLNMINSVSTKQAQVGDRIYLETAFPVLSNGKIVIPQGSWVTGTVTGVIRPGRVKGRGGLQVRFDSLTLPNGVSRDFRADLGAIDARDNQSLQREGSTIKGAGSKGADAGTVVGTTTSGTVIGAGLGSAAGNVGRGSLIGVAGGAAAGLATVLLTRGPDATLSKGSTVEMVLDRPLSYNDSDLNFRDAPPHAPLSQGAAPAPQNRTRLPF